MKLRIQRTGGFAGLREQLLTLDTQTLKPEESKDLCDLWQQLRPRIKEAANNANSIGADFLKYEIFSQDETGEEKLELADDGNEIIQALNEFVQTISKAGH